MSVRALIGLLAITLATIGVLALDDEYRLFLPALLAGTWLTAQITLLGCVLAVVAAILATFARMYGGPVFGAIATLYVQLFRGTSALVQLFWLFFVLPQFGVYLEAFDAAVIALGLNIGAYGSEVVRGAVLAVPRGQWEAATALNMSLPQKLRRIVFPQALVAMIPPWGNLFIELLKSTALVSLITLADLAFKAQQLNQATLQTLPIFSLVLLIYLAMALTITIGMRLLEGRVARGLARGRMS